MGFLVVGFLEESLVSEGWVGFRLRVFVFSEVFSLGFWILVSVG